MLAESIFFNYHKQFKKSLSLIEHKKNIKEILVNFTIPKPKKNTLLSSKKFKGGALMDMGPYAAAIARIFFNERISSYKNYIKKDIYNLITSFKILINYKSKIYSGLFKFGGSYKNNLTIITNKRSISLNRVFSPPFDQNLSLSIEDAKKKKLLRLEKTIVLEIFLMKSKKILKIKNLAFILIV